MLHYERDELRVSWRSTAQIAAALCHESTALSNRRTQTSLSALQQILSRLKSNI